MYFIVSSCLAAVQRKYEGMRKQSLMDIKDGSEQILREQARWEKVQISPTEGLFVSYVEVQTDLIACTI